MKLVIAEKPSVAMSIAKVLQATESKDGYKVGNDYIVSWCVGHLVTSADPQDYDSRYETFDLSMLPMLPQPYKYKLNDSTKKQYDVLLNLMQRDDVDSLVCATDAAREGELIFRLVYNYAGCTKPFERLWISSMEDKAIKEGFAALKDGSYYDNLYRAALARLQADWYVGMNFSRLYSGLYKSKITVGRVQTAVVNLIVKRQLEIDNFKPIPYYVIEADCGDFVAKSNKYDSKEAAEGVIDICNGHSGTVTNIDENQHKDNPPDLFDLTTLQREANKVYGYTAQQVLDCVQSLYEKKLVTYPRTDSKFITEDMQATTEQLIDELLQSHLVDNDIKKSYNKDEKSVIKIIDNSKVSDHHAIIPTKTLLSSDIDNLPKTDINVLNLIIYRLLAAVYKPCVYTETVITLTVNSKEFTVKEKIILEQGYKGVLKYFSNDDKEALPSLDVALNKTYDNIKFNLAEKATAPPKPYDEASLLSAMENAGKQTDNKLYSSILKDCKGIGTPATRASIIEKIIKIGYVERKKKIFVPTNKAYALIKVVPDEVKSVELTAEWEKKLDLISRDELSDTEFIDDIFDYVSSVVQNGKEQADTVDTNMFKKSYEVVGVCPRCGKNILDYPKTYSCESGKDGCGFVIFKNNKWWSEKKKTLSPTMVSKLLKDGKVKVKGLYSEKKDKKYDATVAFVDTGKYINFKLLF